MARTNRVGGQHHPDFPLLPAPLIGRQAEIALAGDLLRAGARLLTLTGPPGVGKTSLALTLGAELAARYAHGASLIDLAPVRDAELVAATIADALGVGGRRQPIGRLIALLRRRGLLLVLDNFEQVVEAAPALAELLAACPDLTILVTSRIPLRIRWEHELPVPPLQLPSPDGPQSAQTIAEIAAVRLFVERARAVKPGFALTDENAPAVVAVCARLDGLPLAIELAAARARLLTPEAMLDQLVAADGRTGAAPGGGALELLTAGPRDLPPRQQTLRDAIAWSYALLAPPERQALRRLAVFAGGCTLGAAQQVSEATWTAIAALIEHGLARQDAGPTGSATRAGYEPRVRLLETVREYALEQLVTRGEEEAIRRRHLAYYLRLAEHAAPKLSGPEQHVWLARLDLERANFRTAMQTATCLDEAESGLRVAAALFRFWRARGDAADVRERVSEVLALASIAQPLPTTVAALQTGGHLAWGMGDYETARALFVRGLDVARQLDDRLGTATALRELCRLAATCGQYDPARRYGEESLAIFSALDDLSGRAGTLRQLGMVSYFLDDHEQARDQFNQSLEAARQLGDARMISEAEFGLALSCHVTGELEAARRSYLRSLEIDRALGHRASEGSLLNNLGHLALLRGDTAEACTLLRESLLASRETGDRRRLGFTLSAVAGLVADLGELELGIRLDAAGKAFLDSLGARLAPAMRAQYERHLESARAALDAAGVEASVLAGQALTLDQAVDEALAWLGQTDEAVASHDRAGSVGRPPAAAAPVGAPRAVGGAAGASARPDGPRLTQREREVAGLIARGLTNRQIAEALVVSDGTAANYVQRVMTRLGVHNRAQVAAWAVERGLHTDRAGPHA